MDVVCSVGQPITIREGFDKLFCILVVHAMRVGEQVEVAAHAVEGAAHRAVLEAEVIAPVVEELLHLFLGELALDNAHGVIGCVSLTFCYTKRDFLTNLLGCEKEFYKTSSHSMLKIYLSIL